VSAEFWVGLACGAPVVVVLTLAAVWLFGAGRFADRAITDALQVWSRTSATKDKTPEQLLSVIKDMKGNS
jgi:hypothetical protein